MSTLFFGDSTACCRAFSLYRFFCFGSASSQILPSCVLVPGRVVQTSNVCQSQPFGGDSQNWTTGSQDPKLGVRTRGAGEAGGPELLRQPGGGGESRARGGQAAGGAGGGRWISFFCRRAEVAQGFGVHAQAENAELAAARDLSDAKSEAGIGPVQVERSTPQLVWLAGSSAQLVSLGF